METAKCYRFGCSNPATEKYQNTQTVSYLNPVCAEHQIKVCKHNECIEVATEYTIINGKKVELCPEHKRIAELGNLEGISLAETFCPNCGDFLSENHECDDRPELIKLLPFKSELDGDQLPVALWQSKRNICELYDPQQVTQMDGVGECDTSGLYYGTDDPWEPKACARHFYQQFVNGDGKTNYRLSDIHLNE